MKNITQLTQEFKQNIAKPYDIPYHWFEVFLLNIINKNKTFLITHSDYVLTDDEYQSYQDGMTKMINGTPLAYVMGVMDFWGMSFKVNEHTLIPRPDTEVLVETVLNFIKNNHINHGSILDLGTGSGCIAISLAKELTGFRMTAVDNSPQALDIARQNARALQADNCEFVLSDWFTNLYVQKFDIIVSNPPYIKPNDKHLKDLTAEPITALIGKDNDGLGDIRQIIHQAKDYLNDNGLIATEHGFDQANAIQMIFKEQNYQNITTIKDYGGNDRLTLARLKRIE